MANKKLRCAIYTRKSTEHGLELEFNSLDAQREACQAYIKSQAAEGWQLVPTAYNDGAYSGGDLDRPALKKLLKDIDAGLVDVIVVYKIDRLTRSLADFAKLVEIFDAKAISFVAITQQFNTTTSMGRLTLNILLSFAQFERELSSERVRDKIAASRKKGKWTGGSVPLGYDSREKKLVINATEAGMVRMIFDRYLALQSFKKVIDELNEKGVVSKLRAVKGRQPGGVPFTYGPLAYLLRNRTYLGQTGHKGVWFPGEHKAIIAEDTFQQVQDLLKNRSARQPAKHHPTGALLTGLLFDDKGNRMSPSFTVKGGVRYCSYVSTAKLSGRQSRAGSRTRVSSEVVEGAVSRLLRQQLPELTGQSSQQIQLAVAHKISRVVLSSADIRIQLKSQAGEPQPELHIAVPAISRHTIQVHEPACAGRKPQQQQLLQALVRAHSWVKLLAGGQHPSVESLSRSVGLHPKAIRSGIRLAFLDPAITKALIEGAQPASLTVKKFAGLIPLRWHEQRAWITGPQPD